MSTVSSDDVLLLFQKTLKARGITDFWFSGPFIWSRLYSLPVKGVNQLVAYAPMREPLTLILSNTPVGRMPCSVLTPTLPRPLYDERMLPSTEWLLCDWIARERRFTIGKMRRHVMQIMSEGVIPFDFEIFREIAADSPYIKPLHKVALTLSRILHREATPEPAPPAHLELPPAEDTGLERPILGIPCDRNGKALRLLAKAETFELTRRYQEHGDIQARNTIALSNVGLAQYSSRRYYCSENTKEDLIQEGYFGLFRGIEGFDVSRNLHFSTYTVQWVRAKMGRFLEKDLASTSAPATEAMGARDQLRIHHRSIDGKMKVNESNHDDYTLQLHERIPDAFLVDPNVALDEETSCDDLLEALTSVLEELDDPRFRVVVERRLLAEEPETLEQVGDRLGLSRERVRQIEVVLHKRLQEVLSVLMG